MKVNENIALLGERVFLVPYRKEHVQKYHEWMLDPELRELTASEPLSLEEEYDMQRKWQEDEDKLTFIVLARGVSSPEGDVNLFFKGSNDEEDFEVEAEVMIAEKAYRRKGYASEALQLLLSFATTHSQPPSLPISAHKLVVRIGDKNNASVSLFSKLGFEVTKHVEVFEELEMRFAGKARCDLWMAGKMIELV